MAAAVAMQHLPDGVTDSKRCSAKQREWLAAAIRDTPGAWALGLADVDEIAAHNILGATLIAMRRAVLGLCVTPTLILVDGLHVPQVPVPCQAMVGGDGSEPLIGAASILAKTHRDGIMRELAQSYPQFGFERHKGYGTRLHLQSLKRHGPCPQHRRDFAPVKACT